MEITAQEFYDRTIAHLETQGRPAHHHDGGCLYRDPYGLKCAIGFWIPDTEYFSKFEGEGVEGVLELVDRDTHPWARTVAQHLGLAKDLQQLHDYIVYWGRHGLSMTGRERAHNIAEFHGLVPYNFPLKGYTNG
jgi:hypothetical protein